MSRVKVQVADTSGGRVTINLEDNSLELRDLFREVIRPLQDWNWEYGDHTDWTSSMTVAEFRQSSLFEDILLGKIK